MAKTATRKKAPRKRAGRAPELEFLPGTRTGAVIDGVADFEGVLRRERQFNLLRTIGELRRARSTAWGTVCRIAGLTEIEISLLNEALMEAARNPRRAA